METLTSIVASIPAQDLARARAFYRDKLDLEPSDESTTGELRYDVGGTSFVLFASSGIPSGTHTQMAFMVGDADTAAADLRSRGVTFDTVAGYDQVDGIATMGSVRGGWFRDSEGNLLGLAQELA